MNIGGLKVLIVEDSKLIAERMNSMLIELDCITEIHQSQNGIEALAMFYKNNPDVVLLDINLPGKSGISVLKEIKSVSNTKVIMLTNFSDQYYRTLCAQLGADSFLDKSTEFDKLPSLLENLVNEVS